MSAGKISALLLLLAVIGSHAAPNPSECEGLTKRLKTKDLNKIFRNWVLVWSVSDHEQGDELLSNISSSHVEFRLFPENKTFSYIERNVYNQNLSSCTTYFMNVTVPSDNDEIQTLRVDNIRFYQKKTSPNCSFTLKTCRPLPYGLEVDGQPEEYNDTGAVDFYESCPNCLMIVYKTSTVRFLLNYKEEGLHRNVELDKASHDDHKKLADCLGFPDKKPYVYDGVADFCHRKSAPEGRLERP